MLNQICNLYQKRNSCNTIHDFIWAKIFEIYEVDKDQLNIKKIAKCQGQIITQTWILKTSVKPTNLLFANFARSDVLYIKMGMQKKFQFRGIQNKKNGDQGKEHVLVFEKAK